MPTFHVHLIKPTRYDTDGYPIQWWRSLVPSNSLACLVGLAEEAAAKKAAEEAAAKNAAKRSPRAAPPAEAAT